MSLTVTSPEGWKLAIGPLPGRKRIAMYHIRGGMLEPLAYFQSEDAADQFCRGMFNRTYPDGEIAAEAVDD